MTVRTFASLTFAVLTASAIAQTIKHQQNFDTFTLGNLKPQGGYDVDLKSNSTATVVASPTRSGNRAVRIAYGNPVSAGSNYAFFSFNDNYNRDTYVATVWARSNSSANNLTSVGMIAFGTNSQDVPYQSAQVGFLSGNTATTIGYLNSRFQFPVNDVATTGQWNKLQLTVMNWNNVLNFTGTHHGTVNGEIVGPAAPGASSDYKTISDFDLFTFNQTGTNIEVFFDDIKVERFSVNDFWISGRVSYESVAPGADMSEWPVTVTLGDNGTFLESKTVTPDADGYFRVKMDSKYGGMIDVYFKGALWLSKKALTLDIPTAAEGDTNNDGFYDLSYYDGGFVKALLAGDCNGDDVITTDDYLIISDAFDTNEGDGGYDSRADLDNNGSITTDDYLYLSTNFDQSGEAPTP